MVAFFVGANYTINDASAPLKSRAVVQIAMSLLHCAIHAMCKPGGHIDACSLGGTKRYFVEKLISSGRNWSALIPLLAVLFVLFKSAVNTLHFAIHATCKPGASILACPLG